MNASSRRAAPCLGEPSAGVAAVLGPPRRVESCGSGIVRWYVQDGHQLAVLFRHNLAVAVHVPYWSSALYRSDFAPMVAQLADAAAVRDYVGDTGLIIATPRCLRTAVDLLAQLADPPALERPRSR